MRSLHREMVVPSNTFMCVFGDIDQKKIIDLIEKKLSGISQNNFNPPTIDPEQGAPGNRSNSLILDKKQTVILLGFNGPSISHPDRWGLAVLTEILSGLRTF